MSAHKRALLTPDSAALRRLDDLSAQLRATSRPDPAQQQAVRQEALVELGQAAAHVQQRQEQITTRMDEALAGMETRLHELEQATTQALASQAQVLQQRAAEELVQAQASLAEHSEALLAEQRQEFTHLLRQNQERQRAAIQRLEGRLLRQGQGRRQAAVQELRQAQALLEGLQQAYPQAGALTGLESLLTQAQHNLASGLAEAALATAQQASYHLSELRLSLERELAERSLLRAAARERLGQVQALLSANQVVSAVDLDGRSLDYPLEVDYWTGGGWTQQWKELQEARAYLEQPAEVLQPEDLRCLVREYLPAIEQAVPELVAQARRNALASQLRFNMAEAVLSALGEQGFALEQASYLEGDMRQAYRLALHNLEGSQLVITLAPQGGSLEHQLDLVSQDQPKHTPHELRQRARELARSLRRYGLQVSSPATAPAVAEQRAPYFTRQEKESRTTQTQSTLKH